MNFIKIAVVLTSAIMMSCSVAFAEIKTFTKEYTYSASELDSQVTSRYNALEQAKRLLLEELGIFMTSQTVVINAQLTKDEITSLSAGIVSAVVLDEKWDGHKYWLKAKIDADPSAVEQAIEVIKNDKNKSDELEQANKRINQLSKELETIKINVANNPQDRQKQYIQIVNQKESQDWIFTFNKLYDKSKSLAENKEALDAINKAIELSPDYWLVYLKRSMLYQDVAKDYEKSIKDLTSAIHTITPAQNLNETLGILYDARARLFLLQNKLLLAINDFMTALKIEPTGDFMEKDFILMAVKLNIADLNKIVRKYPKDYRSYVLRAKFNSNPSSDSDNINAYDNAISDLKKALRLNKSDFIIYYVLAQAHKWKAFKYEQKYPEKKDITNRSGIIDAATIGLKLKSSNEWKKYFLELRAQEYLDLKEYRQSIVDYNSIFQLVPNLAKTYIDRALVYIETKQFDEAIRDLTKVLEQNDNSKEVYRDAYDVRASTYEAMGKYKDAINDYTNLLSNEDVDEPPCAYISGSCLFLRRRAEAHRKVGEYEQAISDYNKAITLAFKSQKTHFYKDIGDTYVQMDDQEKAIAEYTKAILGSESPDNSYAYYNRARAYIKFGKNEQGIEDLRISARLGNQDAKQALKDNNLEE